MKNIFYLIFILCCSQANAQSLVDCSDCSKKMVTSTEIKALSIDDIRFLTNDLFARKGYKFTSTDVDNYYSEKVWYKPVSDNNTIIYNEIEKQNIKLFQDRTTEIKKERALLITELLHFKAAVLKDDHATLSAKYGYSYTDQNEYLKKALEKINFDDVHWSFDRGLYKVTVDNGETVMNYEFSIHSNRFNVQYGNQGGTEIGKQIYPNDHITEFSFWWEFEWKNNKIKFLKVDMAG